MLVVVADGVKAPSPESLIQPHTHIISPVMKLNAILCVCTFCHAILEALRPRLWSLNVKKH